MKIILRCLRILKWLIIIGIIVILILITSCVIGCYNCFSSKGGWEALYSSVMTSIVRTELLEDRIELDMDYYEVDKSGLVSIIDSGAIYEISGISTDDIVCAYRYPLYYLHELPTIYLNPHSEIKEPVLDLESKALVVNGVEAPVAYSEIIKTAMKSGNLGYNPGKRTNFKIYLNDGNSFYFKGEIIRVEATEKYEPRYYCSGYKHNATYHLLEDEDGFYDWLDENVFGITDETDEPAEEVVPAA